MANPVSTYSILNKQQSIIKKDAQLTISWRRSPYYIYNRKACKPNLCFDNMCFVSNDLNMSILTDIIILL